MFTLLFDTKLNTRKLQTQRWNSIGAINNIKFQTIISYNYMKNGVCLEKKPTKRPKFFTLFDKCLKIFFRFWSHMQRANHKPLMGYLAVRATETSNLNASLQQDRYLVFLEIDMAGFAMHNIVAAKEFETEVLRCTTGTFTHVKKFDFIECKGNWFDRIQEHRKNKSGTETLLQNSGINRTKNTFLKFQNFLNSEPASSR